MNTFLYGADVLELREEHVETSEESARVIVVTSGKGGVGKTTTTANLGASLARLGYETCLIDADIGLNNLDLLLGLEGRVNYSAFDVLRMNVTIEQALVRDKRFPNLSLLPIATTRQQFELTQRDMLLFIQMLQERDFQFIVIDCPAGIDDGFSNAIVAADEAIVVTTPEITAIRDADRVGALLYRNNITSTRLLVNRVRPDMVKKNNMMSVADVQQMLALPLIGVIPEDREVITSTNRGIPLIVRNKLSVAGLGFENAARRIAGSEAPVMALDDLTSWLKFMKFLSSKVIFTDIDVEKQNFEETDFELTLEEGASFDEEEDERDCA